MLVDICIGIDLNATLDIDKKAIKNDIENAVFAALEEMPKEVLIDKLYTAYKQYGQLVSVYEADADECLYTQ